jgi:hypothetical protein
MTGIATRSVARSTGGFVHQSTAIWHMITNRVPYTEPGGDLNTRRNPDKTKNGAIDQLRRLDYDVSLSPPRADVAR